MTPASLSSELVVSVLTKENLILSGSTGNPDRNEAAIAAFSSVAIGRKIEVEENTVTIAHGPNLTRKRNEQKNILAIDIQAFEANAYHLPPTSIPESLCRHNVTADSGFWSAFAAFNESVLRRVVRATDERFTDVEICTIISHCKWSNGSESAAGGGCADSS